MSDAHFFVGEPAEAGASLLLSPEDSRHALRSLRLRPGRRVTLADGRGWFARGRLAGERGSLAAVDVEEVSVVPRPVPRLSVALAPPKGERLSWAVQKLAELGVDDILLVRGERSVRAWDAGRAGHAQARLAAVAREAAMQSRGLFVSEVAVARHDLAGEIGAAVEAGAVAVVLHGGSGEGLDGALPGGANRILLAVGPEGGLTDGEVADARQRGAAVASLGEGVLRTETAAVVGAALVLHRYGRLG